MRLCEDCGKPIPKARLAALPSATLCVKCRAQEDERPLRAWDLGDNLAALGEITPGEAQRMFQRGG